MSSPLEELNESMQKSGKDNWVRYSTAEEIDALAPGELTIPDRPITAAIDDWSFLTISDMGVVRVHIIGNILGTTTTRITSPLVVADRRTWQVLTKSGSIYDLGTAHTGELDMQQACALAKSIQSWRASAARFYELKDWIMSGQIDEEDTRH